MQCISTTIRTIHYVVSSSVFGEWPYEQSSSYTIGKRAHTKASSKIKRLGRSVSQRRMPRETEKPPLTMIDGKPTDGTSLSKKDQDGHGMMKSDNFSKCSESRRRIEDFFQDGHGVMNVDFFPTDVFFSFVHMY